MFVQNKVPKQKDTPYRLFPALLQKVGRCGTRFAQTVLAQNSPIFKSSQARQQGVFTSKSCEVSRLGRSAIYKVNAEGRESALGYCAKKLRDLKIAPALKLRHSGVGQNPDEYQIEGWCFIVAVLVATWPRFWPTPE